MNDTEIFFRNLEQQFANQLPFVVYSRPIYSTIKCWLQKDDALHTTNNFTESGFVFAPFNLQTNVAVLFPEEASIYNSIDTKTTFETAVKNTNSNSVNSEIEESHIKLVNKAINSIKTNAFTKVVLSRYQTFSTSTNKPIEVFKTLYANYKNAMVYCWYHPKVGLWLGATPELLFKTEGQQLTTISLAGTKAYQPNTTPHWTDKELDEQHIVTEYLETQIKPFTQHTTRSEVETIRAGKLWHLKTRLKSRLHPNFKLLHIIEALHPTPAVCGFPKNIAKQFILENEGYNREFYTGFLGELNLKQTKTRNTNRHNVENNAYQTVKTQSNFYVNLRCMQFCNNQALLYVGGGITKHSNANNEWQETCNKLKTMATVIQ